MKAYFTEGVAIGERGELVRLAVEVGFDEADVKGMLSSDQFANEVRADEARARAFGISGVPFFAIDERYGVSGAQPTDVLLDALRQAYVNSQMVVVGGDDADSCADGSCAV